MLARLFAGLFPAISAAICCHRHHRHINFASLHQFGNIAVIDYRSILLTDFHQAAGYLLQFHQVSFNQVQQQVTNKLQTIGVSTINHQQVVQVSNNNSLTSDHHHSTTVFSTRAPQAQAGCQSAPAPPPARPPHQGPGALRTGRHQLTSLYHTALGNQLLTPPLFYSNRAFRLAADIITLTTASFLFLSLREPLPHRHQILLLFS